MRAVSPGLLALVFIAAPAGADEPERPGPEPSASAASLNLREAADSVLAHSVLSGFSQIEYLQRQISLDELSAGDRSLLNEDQFQVRRARLRLDTDWERAGFSFEAEVFAGGDTVRPVAFDIHATVLAGEDKARPALRTAVGLMPVPFGFEMFEQTNVMRFFGERTLLTQAFMPGRFDLGATVSGSFSGVDWWVGAFNGEPIESPNFAYRDPNKAKDLTGRIKLHGELFPEVQVAIALSLLAGTGFSPGTPPTKDSFEWQDLNEDGRVIPSELIPIPGSAGRASENFRRWAAGADFQVRTRIPHLGQLDVYGELGMGSNIDRFVAPADPVLLGRDQQSIGWYLAATQHFLGFMTAGTRFEQYEPNVDELELFGGSSVVTRRRFRTLALGLSADLALTKHSWARLLLEYEIQQNTLGRDESGRPDNLDNNTLRLRAQVAF